MLRIRFGGFSVLKITKGLKANWVDKLSHFGGTAGLFTGVSFITIFEVLILIVPCMLSCKSKEHEVKISQKVEAKPSKEYENTIEDLKKRFDAMEKKMIVHDYTMIEDNQHFEDYEKALDTLTKKMDRMDAMNSKIMEVMEKLIGEKKN